MVELCRQPGADPTEVGVCRPSAGLDHQPVPPPSDLEVQDGFRAEKVLQAGAELQQDRLPVARVVSGKKWLVAGGGGIDPPTVPYHEIAPADEGGWVGVTEQWSDRGNIAAVVALQQCRGPLRLRKAVVFRQRHDRSPGRADSGGVRPSTRQNRSGSDDLVAPEALEGLVAGGQCGRRLGDDDQFQAIGNTLTAKMVNRRFDRREVAGCGENDAQCRDPPILRHLNAPAAVVSGAPSRDTTLPSWDDLSAAFTMRAACRPSSIEAGMDSPVASAPMMRSHWRA